MAHDKTLVQRIRDMRSGRNDVVERKMFGSIAFMVSGRMACGPLGDRLIVRLGEAAATKHIGKPHVKPMDFTGRVMKAFATIEPEGLRTPAQLRKWVNLAIAFATADQQEWAGSKPALTRRMPTSR